MYIANQGKIMRKLLGKQSVESSLDHTTGPTPSVTSSPLPSSSAAAYRPSASQNITFPTGAPTSTLDRSPDGRSAVLAGRYILKTIHVDGLDVKEGLDVRALIQAQTAPKNGPASSSADQLSIADVKWASGQADSSIFTACANGKIFQYNLARLGQGGNASGSLEFVSMREDSRQVTTLDINPHRGTYLLSGSQDGLVRCFDIRAPVATRGGPTFRAVQAFKCNADSVRHVQWSPRDGFSFACATEQGVVLKWDIRKAQAPLLKINAHDKACSAIAWHMDGEHLVSAGMDSRLKVWDVGKTADKRQRPKWVVSTPAPVASVCWRPGQWSATAQGRRAAQVAVSYEERGQKRFNAVHVWDLARVTMPYKEIESSDASPAAMLWCDTDLLWTVGQDGLFNQCDVAYAPKVLDRLSMSSMAFSARGEVAMFLDERQASRRPRYSIVHGERPPTSSYGSSPSTPMLSISRSDSEDDVLASFLGPRRRTGRKRRPSTRSTTNLSSTPPSGHGGEDQVVPLEQSVKMVTYKSQQAMAIGPVPSAAKGHVYQYLSTIYLETLHSELPYRRGGRSLPKRLADIMEHYAMAAENVGQFRLGQTWRVLAYAMDMLLRTRAQYHMEKRLRQGSQGRRGSPDLRHWNGDEHSDHDDDIPRRSSSTDHPIHLRSLLSEELESTSNVPTPVARPVADELSEELRQAAGIDTNWRGHGQRLSPVAEGGSFSIGPAAFPRSLEHRQRLDSEPISETSRQSEDTFASTEGYDFYDTNALAEAIGSLPKAIDVPQVKKPKPAPAVGFVEPASPERAHRPLVRHNSDDSYAQMFSISQTSGNSTSSGGSQPRRIPRSQPNEEPLTAGSSDGQYANRMRGNQISSSPASQGLLRKALQRGESQLTATTSTTDEDDFRLTTQTTSDSFHSNDYPYSHASPADLAHGPSSLPHSSSGSQSPTHDNIIETDYLPWTSDAPYPFPTPSTLHPSSPLQIPAPPLNPYTMLKRALAFETKTSALNAAAMVLLLAPLVPDDVVDEHQAAAILAQYHRRLMGMRCFVEAALLRNLCVQGWPGGVLSSWGRNYEGVSNLATRGVSCGRMCGQCGKPWEGGGWKCKRCKSVMGPCAICGVREGTSNAVPVEAGLRATEKPAGGEASRIGEDQADASLLTTWWYCPGCGHGGHATCLEAWHSPLPGSTSSASPLVGGENPPTPMSPGGHLAFAEPGDAGAMYSDGCCPLDGCGHACLPGRARAEAVAARSEELARTRVVRESARERSGRGSPVLGAIGGPGVGMGIQMGMGDRRTSGEYIRGDGYEVGQSRAVESVRESLAGESGRDRDTGKGGVIGGVLLSSSPGRGSGFGEGRDRERRKSVKFVQGSGESR